MKIKTVNIMWFMFVLSLPLEAVSYYSGFTIKLWMLILFPALFLWMINFSTRKVKILTPIFATILLGIMFADLMSGINAVNNGRLYRMIIQYGMLSMLAFYTANSIKTEKQVKSVVCYMVFSCVALSIYGILQFAGGLNGVDVKLPIESMTKYNPDNAAFYTIWWIQIGNLALPRIRATFADPTLCGGYLLTIVPLIISMATYRISIKKGYGIYVLFGFVSLVAAIATFSRSAMAGMAVAIGINVYYWRKNFMKKQFAKRLFAVALTGIIIGSIMTMFLPEKMRNAVNPAIIVQRFGQTLMKNDESTSIHFTLAKHALGMWLEYPLLGVGIGNFGAHLGHGYGETSMSHSAILSFFAETGLLGAAANFTLILALILLLIMNIRNTEKYSFWFAVNVGLLASYIGTVSGNLTYHYYNQAYLWFLMGFIVAVVRVNRIARQNIQVSVGQHPVTGSSLQ